MAKKAAFTLLELLLVVIIMGIVYSMVSIALPQEKKTLPVLSSATLGEVMRLLPKGSVYSFYLYGQSCEYAAFVPALPEGIQLGAIKFSRDIEAYEIDPYGSPRRREFAPLHIEGNEYKVCLKFDRYQNGTISSYIYRVGETFYQNNPYFDLLFTSKSLDEALEAFMRKTLNPNDLGAH